MTVSTEVRAETEAAPVRTSKAYAWYVVAVLVAASTLSFVDRQILAIMIDPVKADLLISDTQAGLLVGLSFAIFYTLMTAPMARLADSFNRKWLIMGGITLWSILTALCGLSQRFYQLFLARMGVGVGEATLGPASFSIICDYFDNKTMPMAMAVYYTAPFLGIGLASLAGGPLIEYLDTLAPVSLPLVGEMKSWQLAFLFAAAPAPLVLILMTTVREPIRRGVASAFSSQEGRKGVPLAAIAAFLRERARFFSFMFAALAMLTVMGYSIFAWVVPMLTRVHGLGVGDAGFSYGAIALTFGVGGSFAAGFFTSWLVARGGADAAMRVIMVGSFAVCPLVIALAVAPNATVALILLCPITFIMGMPGGLAQAALGAITPNQIRAQTLAVYFIVVNFIGYGFGPVFVGLFNDYIYTPAEVHYSVATLGGALYFGAGLLTWLSLPHFRLALQAAESWNEEG